TALLTELPKTETYTRAYAESNGFLTLLSDGRRLTGAYALGPRGGRVAPAGHARHPRPGSARRPARCHPALPDVLGDLRRRAQGTAHRNRSCTEHSMSTATTTAPTPREPDLLRQPVLVLSGRAGLGLDP